MVGEPEGLVRLECRVCKCVYETLHPALDEVEWAVCPTCRQRDEEDTSEIYPLSRAD